MTIALKNPVSTTNTRPGLIKVVAVLLAATSALFARAWLQTKLLAGGALHDYAADLSYLIVPVMLCIMLAPLLYEDRHFLARQFTRASISPRIVLYAILVGVLLRLVSWTKLVAAVSFGVHRNTDPAAVEGPLFHFQCSSPAVVALGFLVMAIMVPLIEEVVHRSYVQSHLRHRGAVIAVLVSALVFAAFHRPSTWSFSFIAGIVFGMQYWISGSLWPSLLSHATVNALILADWRCLGTQWNPPAAELPLLLPGGLSIGLLAASIAAIAWLLKKHRGS